MVFHTSRPSIWQGPEQNAAGVCAPCASTNKHIVRLSQEIMCAPRWLCDTKMSSEGGIMRLMARERRVPCGPGAHRIFLEGREKSHETEGFQTLAQEPRPVPEGGR